jgi:hypothetical protein
MTGKIFKLGVALVVAAAVGGVAVRAADSPETIEKMKLKRRLMQMPNQHRPWKTDPRAGHRVDGGNDKWSAELEQSIIANSGVSVSPLLYAASAAAPPPSPGLPFGKTSYDYQHNQGQGWQVGRTAGANIAHMIWMHWNKIPISIENADRFVHYNSYTVSTGAFNQGFDGCQVSLGVAARGGYTDGGVGSANDAWGFEHQKPDEGLPYSSYAHWFPSPGECLHIDNEMATNGVFGEVLWPHGNVQRNAGGADVTHVVSHGANEDPKDRIIYWRYAGVSWQGPVALDSNGALSYVVTGDANSDDVAAVMFTDYEAGLGSLENVAYYESNDEGASWISGAGLGPANKVIITDYTSPTGPEGYYHISASYDDDGTLNIVWDELRQSGQLNQVAIRHWNDVRNTIRPVALAYYDKPLGPSAFNQNLAKVTMGIGDGGTTCGGGSNQNFLYVLYTKFAGETAVEQADWSALGEYNGELVLSISNSSGNTWSPPLNLTNTKTPGCNPGPGTPENPNPPRPDSVCRSEHWATIGEIVDDIDIFLVSDLDAGGIPQGEGTWQMNPVHYWRISDADTICPLIQANFAAFITGRIDCEYHAAPGASTTENLTIINLGNATMSGAISKTQFNGPGGWLTVAGLGGYTILAGDPDLTPLVTMSAAGVADGTLLQGQIEVTHNDPSKPSPQLFPVNFFVFTEFYCPENEVLRTGVSSPGSLGLEVNSNGRYGSQNDQGGLFRYGDSSSAIFDGSFLLAYGSQGPDTTVFLRFFDRATRGQFGWRAQSHLDTNTTAYTTGQGAATATAAMSTKDSVIGVDVTWYFPQHADSDEFVIGRWRIYSHDGAAHSNVVVGLLEDQDVVPAAKWGQLQNGVDNLPGSEIGKKLIWQQGTDTLLHPPNPVKTATRYRNGIRLISDYALPGATVGNNARVNDGGGPSDGFLYRGLVASGIEMFTDSANGTDLYSLMVLARGFSVGAADTKGLESVGDTVDVVAALVSDTVDLASFKAASDKAEAWARGRGIVSGWLSCQCAPCFANPACGDNVVSVQDVVATVAVAFRGGVEVQDPTCRKSRTDVNCDGVTSVQDVVAIVSVAFRGGNALTAFCNPCSLIPGAQ